MKLTIISKYWSRVYGMWYAIVWEGEMYRTIPYNLAS